MDFNLIHNRVGSGSLKWDRLMKVEGKEDIIPLWVADMDIPSPDFIVNAIEERAVHPFYGYTDPPDGFFKALSDWYEKRYKIRIKENDFLLGPGVLQSMATTIRALTNRNDGVIIMPPVYYPFFSLIADNDRTPVEAPLQYDATGSLRFDFARMESAIAKSAEKGITSKALLLCSPQNPGGRVWTKKELTELAEFAIKHSLVIVSDEIHADIILGEKKFISIAGIPEASDRTIILSGPNKTFNLAGLHISHFVITHPGLKKIITREVVASGFSQANVLSLTATYAAYTGPTEWLDALNAYIKSNAEFIVKEISSETVGMTASLPEGTYLVWVDAGELIRRLGLSDDKELVKRIESEARVKLNAGSIYGTGGEGFIRINIACPKLLLETSLNRIFEWIKNVQPA